MITAFGCHTVELISKAQNHTQYGNPYQDRDRVRCKIELVPNTRDYTRYENPHQDRNGIHFSSISTLIDYARGYKKLSDLLSAHFHFNTPLLCFLAYEF